MERIDGHTHLDFLKLGAEERREGRRMVLDWLRQTELTICVSASLEEECERLLSLAEGSDRIFCSLGVHPWDAARLDAASLEEGGRMMRLLAQGNAVGEIGMDREWCEVPIPLQRQVFERQLDLAEEWGMPVVLHTKGCELEIAGILEERPRLNPVLVHWYSGPEEALIRMAERDCYFSVGPDVERNASVLQVVRRVRLDRLLTETDGISALEWVKKRKVAPNEMSGVLNAILRRIAAEKGVPMDAAAVQVEQNFRRFFSKTAAR